MTPEFKDIKYDDQIGGKVQFPGVLMDVVADRGKYASIYEFSGDGSGQARQALKDLRDYGGLVVVHDPGAPGTDSRSFWDKMFAEKLIDQMRDADDNLISEQKVLRTCNYNPLQDPSIAANGEQVSQNFSTWFSGSKITSSSGEPLVVYHGTASDFNSFELGHSNFEASATSLGHFFTSDIALANTYATHEFVTPDGAGAQVLPVFLNIQSPKVEKQSVLALIEGEWSEDETADYLEDLQALGHDGIVFKGAGPTEYVVFSATQIKSALGNSGLFLPNSSSLDDQAEALILKSANEAKETIERMVPSNARKVQP